MTTRRPDRRRGGIIVGLIIGPVATLSPTAGCAPDPPEAVVEIAVAPRCSPVAEQGMGMIIDNGLILTSAHVVAGHTTAQVTIDGRNVDADVVAFDPHNDLAYLQPVQPPARATAAPGWRLAATDQIFAISDGTIASTYVERDGVVTRLDATIVRRVQINTEDIYVDDDVTRPGWELRVAIERGDSGAPVVVDGRVVGVIWATSRKTADRAYAIDPVRGGELIERQLAEHEIEVEPDIDLTRC